MGITPVQVGIAPATRDDANTRFRTRKSPFHPNVTRCSASDFDDFPKDFCPKIRS